MSKERYGKAINEIAKRLAARYLNGEEWHLLSVEISDDLHSAVTEIVNGRLEGRDEINQKKGE